CGGIPKGRADHDAQRVTAAAAVCVTGEHRAVPCRVARWFAQRCRVRFPSPEVVMEELRGAAPGNIRLLRVMGTERVRVVEERVARGIHVYPGSLPGLLFDGVDEFGHL